MSREGDRGDDRPGNELPKDFRKVARELVDNQHWRYDNSRKGHPVLYPADRNQPPLAVPTTPKRGGRGFANWIADVRRRGGHWPPKRTR